MIVMKFGGASVQDAQAIGRVATVVRDTQSRTILPIVFVVLGIVLIWWLWIWPHTPMSKAHRREAEMKEKLQSIRPLDGAQPRDIQIMRLKNPDSILAMRSDLGKGDCVAGGMHYRKEFANAGFGYNGEKVDEKQKARTFSFAGSDYHAEVACVQIMPEFSFYSITMWSQGA
jgi:hypothetical protein